MNNKLNLFLVVFNIIFCFKIASSEAIKTNSFFSLSVDLLPSGELKISSTDDDFKTFFGQSEFSAKSRAMVLVQASNFAYESALLLDDRILKQNGDWVQLEKGTLDLTKYVAIQGGCLYEDFFIVNDYATSFSSAMASLRAPKFGTKNSSINDKEGNVLKSALEVVWPIKGGFLLFKNDGLQHTMYSLLDYKLKFYWFENQNFQDIKAKPVYLWQMHRFEGQLLQILSYQYLSSKLTNGYLIYGFSPFEAWQKDNNIYSLIIPLMHQEAAIAILNKSLSVVAFSDNFKKEMAVLPNDLSYLKVANNALESSKTKYFGNFTLANSVAEVWVNGQEIYFTEKHNLLVKNDLKDTAIIYHINGSVLAKGNYLQYQKPFIVINSDMSGKSVDYLFNGSISARPHNFLKVELYATGALVQNFEYQYGFLLPNDEFLFKTKYSIIDVFSKVIVARNNSSDVAQIKLTDNSQSFEEGEIKSVESCVDGTSLAINKNNLWGLMDYNGKWKITPSKATKELLKCD